MASKKTLMVNFARVTRKRWSLMLSGTDPDLLDQLATAISNAKSRGVAVINAADPFGEAKAVEKEKKKPRKPRSDKGARRAEHTAGDGQVGAGTT